MNAFPGVAALAVALLLPVAALAQSSDAEYCSALGDKYALLLNQGPRHGGPSASVDAQVAIAKCKAGDTAAGIPALENALRNARIDLPPRG